jgi:nicotinamidase-related amidase
VAKVIANTYINHLTYKPINPLNRKILNMRITKENTAGLVIDIQERLFPVMNNKEQLLKNTQILIAGLKELGIPTHFTQQYSKGLGETLENVKSLVDNFTYFEKADFSCFDASEYKNALKESEVKNIIICGIEAHVCVLQTAVDLKEAGYNPIIVADCISSRSEENKALALERFRFENILTTSYESILFELARSAKAPEFKAISKLVK